MERLSQQFNQYNPVREVGVVTSQTGMPEDVKAQLQLQSQRVDLIGETVHTIQKDTANNAELLQTLLVNLENLGESVKQLRSEMTEWGNQEVQIETEEDRVYKETAAQLLQEVSLSFPSTENPVASTLVSIPMSVATSELSRPSSSILSSNANQDMQARLTAARQPMTEGFHSGSQQGFNFSLDKIKPGKWTVIQMHDLNLRCINRLRRYGRVFLN